MGIALSEKQIPQVVVNTEKWCERMEELERAFVLRRQTLYPTELRARCDYFLCLMYITQRSRATKFGCKWAILGATEPVLEK